MRRRQILLAATLAASIASPAWADANVYYHAGGWDAFDGQGANGQPLCGVGSRNPADGRAFSLRFQIGGDEVTFIASKPSWNIPDGAQIPVVVQVGLQRPWSEQAVGSGERVQWTLDRADIQTFDGQFRRAASMTVTFPSGNEKPWIIALDGSTAVSNAMGRCVTDLTQRAAAARPSAAPAAAEQNTTQPFDAGPATPGNPAPAQPAAPAQQTQPNKSH
ncbi:MAG TPA: hypothetical protein VND19_14030 [Acetobacteraceae bacterium]|nr:hypothetical protein [Acetobacteraceae bacterium]